MITRQMGASTTLAPGLTIPAPAIIAFVGAAIAVVGSALPWVTIFGGTQTLTGWNGTPRYLAGLAVASAAFVVLFLRAGRPVAFRHLAALSGLIVVAGTALDIWQVASMAHSRSVTAQLLEPSLGPGPFVMLAGALSLLAVVLVPASTYRVPAGLWPRVMLAGALFVAGWIHLALTPDHLAEATILGVGFLLAGLAQLALAGLITVRPSNLAYYAVVALSASLIVLYAIAVLKGLPFGGGNDHAGGLLVGSGEPVDLQGAVSKLAELFSLAAALVLVGRRDAITVR
ncbi:MAG: hypothetical protein ACYDAL_03205 [Candidatus Dormibacteraceae bacterium]